MCSDIFQDALTELIFPTRHEKISTLFQMMARQAPRQARRVTDLNRLVFTHRKDYKFEADSTADQMTDHGVYSSAVKKAVEHSG